MDISAKLLREVEFRERLRGYDTDEVDEFLEKVAASVDALRGEIQEAVDRAEKAERAERERPVIEDDESLRRTLVLAQRTADLAIKEAQDEAAGILASARGERDAIIAQANEDSKGITSDAHRRLADDVDRLSVSRDRLLSDVRTLSDLLDNERARLTDALSSALRWIETSLVSRGLESHRSLISPPVGPDPASDVEANIQQDADAALSSVPETSPLAAPVPAASVDGPPEQQSDSETGGGGETSPGETSPGEVQARDLVATGTDGAGSRPVLGLVQAGGAARTPAADPRPTEPEYQGEPLEGVTMRERVAVGEHPVPSPRAGRLLPDDDLSGPNTEVWQPGFAPGGSGPTV